MPSKTSSAWPILIVIVLLVAGLAGGAWWLLRTPPLATNEARVTYTTGEQCLWTDWQFTIRREVQNNSVRGNALIVGRPKVQTATDSVLRVFSATGEKMLMEQIREMNFRTVPDSNNTSNNRVSSLVITTATGEETFRATPLPKFSRSRVLVPVASHYFPKQSDEYTTWGNVRMTLSGTPDAECSIDDEISLTRPGHYKKRTPERVEFGAP